VAGSRLSNGVPDLAECQNLVLHSMGYGEAVQQTARSVGTARGLKWVDTTSEDDRDPDMLETTVSVFWADANLDADMDTNGRDPQTWRPMIVNPRNMPLVITPVNGEPLDGRHVLSTAGRQCSP